MRTGISLVIAFGVGVLAGWALASIGAEPSPAPTSEAAPPETTSTELSTAPRSQGLFTVRPDAPAPVPAACAPYAGEIERLKTEGAVLQRQITLLGGARAEWPEEVPEPFRAESVRAWLDQALEGQPLELVELSCDEYPCVAVFRFPKGQPADSKVLDPLRRAFSDYTVGTHQPRISLFSTDDAAIGVLSLGPTGLPPEASERLDVRLDELGESYRQP